jgi:hypothetical protein
VGQTRYSCVSPSELFSGASRHHFRLRKALRSDGEFVLTDGAQYASTQERFATSPSKGQETAGEDADDQRYQ